MKKAFEAITSFLLLAYKNMGTPAIFAKDSSVRPASSHSIAGFCFARNEEYDILVYGKKLGGNAQKRKHGIILQHGSIPLAFDSKKAGAFLKDKTMLNDLNITCMHEISKDLADFDKLSSALTKAFSSNFNTILNDGSLTEEEIRSSDELKTGKYSTVEWNINATCAQAKVA